jgi:periplasmic protein TonB
MKKINLLIINEMKTRKNSKADLEKKRGLFLLIGLIISLGAIFAVFSIKSEMQAAGIFKPIDQPLPPDDIIEIVNTKEEITPPPPIFRPTDVIFITEKGIEYEDPDIELWDENTPPEFFKNLTLRKEEDVSDDNEVIDFAEVMPEYPGGEAGLRIWIAKNLKYPQIAIQNEIEGIVFVQFVIDKNGMMSNVRVARGIDKALDEEALRVVKTLGNWKPGMQNGKPVRVNFTIPIRFRLEN